MFLRKLKSTLFRNYARVIDFTDRIPGYDIRKSKISSAFGYLFFFIPLIFNEGEQFARFHCNQALLNLLLSTIFAVMLSMIPVVGWALLLLQELICICLAVRGVMLASAGKAVGIPFIGWITLVAYRLPGQHE